MKKFFPFILPALVVIAIIYLGYQFYQKRTEERLTVPEVTAGTEIENLSASELALLENIQKGLGDYETIKMTGTGIGEIRYEIRDGKVLFSVNANLPTGAGEIYTLYIKEASAPDFTTSKTLEEGKGGLFASAAVTIDKLPITIEIRQESAVVLRGEIQAPSQLPLDNLEN
jgi:hypothetical protein